MFEQVTKNVVVHYKERMITIVDVNLDMNQVIDLFRDVRGLAVEQGVVLPKYTGFKWHPPGRENQTWPLNTDNDWVMLVHQCESIRGFVIPIYVVELYVPSQLQKVVESLDGLQKAKEKETVQFTSPCEPTLDSSLTEARMWADNLIVTPIICIHRPKCSSTSPAHVKRYTTCFKKTFYIWEAEIID